MARLDEQRRALAMNIRFERAAENELTPAQARLFVRSLQTSWQVPPIAWGPRESHEQFEDARRRLHGAGIFREIDGEGSPESLSCYRRAAELLEWLARSSDPVTRDVPVSGRVPAGRVGVLEIHLVAIAQDVVFNGHASKPIWDRSSQVEQRKAMSTNRRYRC
jgi:hypothetical protein